MAKLGIFETGALYQNGDGGPIYRCIGFSLEPTVHLLPIDLPACGCRNDLSIIPTAPLWQNFVRLVPDRPVQSQEGE